MAEWSNLPVELLQLISRRLSSEIDLLRFRSVCPTWRRSAIRRTLISRLPIIPVDGISVRTNVQGFILSKRTVYCVKRPLSDERSWIVKLDHDGHDRLRLINPFISWHPFEPFPGIFPKFFDFWNSQILELACMYTLDDIGGPLSRKVAFYFDPKDSVFYVLFVQLTGQLAMYKSSDTKWTCMNDPLHFFDDVIFYSGNFYAITSDGSIVVVNLDSNGCCPPCTSLVAGPPITVWERLVLVESCGDLLLVNMCLTLLPEYDYDKLAVLRLDITGKCWVRVTSLGDRILFLGHYDCSFSASVSELSIKGERGNCILYAAVDKPCGGDDDEEDWLSEVGVFDLEDGRCGPLSSYPGYSEVFSPTWIYEASK